MTPEASFNEMLARYDRAVAKVGRGAIARLRKLMPGAVRLVYDNAYALVMGFGATDRASEAVLSVVVFTDHVTVCFLWGAELDDPDGLLRGGGRQVRHIRLENERDLDKPKVKRLLKAAIAASESPFKKTGGSVEIRAVSGKQRPRRKAK